MVKYQIDYLLLQSPRRTQRAVCLEDSTLLRTSDDCCVVLFSGCSSAVEPFVLACGGVVVSLRQVVPSLSAERRGMHPWRVQLTPPVLATLAAWSGRLDALALAK